MALLVISPSLASPTTDFYQALGSMVGAIGSVLAVLATGLLLWHEVRSRNEERRDAEAAQARLVVMRLVHLNRFGAGPGHGLTAVEWQVTNHSRAPILGIMLGIMRRDEHVTDSCSYVSRDVVAPGGTVSDQWRLNPPIPWPKDQTEPPLHYLTMHLEFMDANGLVWDRTDSEPVRRHVGPPHPAFWQRWRWLVGRWLHERWSRLRKRAHSQRL